MKVETILSSKGGKVATIRPESSIAMLVGRLKAEGIGAMVVSRDDAHIDGIISERDVVSALAHHGGDVMSLKVSDLMSQAVVTCKPDDTVRHCMGVMTQRRVRHLPVVDGGAMVGIISIGDVVKSRLEEVELEANVLRDAYMAGH